MRSHEQNPQSAGQGIHQSGRRPAAAFSEKLPQVDGLGLAAKLFENDQSGLPHQHAACLQAVSCLALQQDREGGRQADGAGAEEVKSQEKAASARLVHARQAYRSQVR